MFDAKSLLESLVKGSQPTSTQSGQAGAPGGMPDLSDLLGKLQSGAKDGAGGLGDLLGKFGSTDAGKAAGGLGDLLGGVLGQATSGVKEGAGKINDATGAGDALGDLAKQLSGKSPEEMIAAVKDLIANNQLGAGAALGGLGALILGTSTGRSVAVGAAKLGALALIGGLAYKAYQNYSDGKPLVDTGQNSAQAAPDGSGFEPDAVTNEQASMMIRAMIAAAAADGRVDASEHERILGGLKQVGIDGEAEEFLAGELNNPASIDDIAGGVRSKEDAVKVYTAARIAIDPDTGGENAFLALLASKLGIDADLAAHIDAAARSA